MKGVGKSKYGYLNRYLNTCLRQADSRPLCTNTDAWISKGESPSCPSATDGRPCLELFRIPQVIPPIVHLRHPPKQAVLA